MQSPLTKRFRPVALACLLTAAGLSSAHAERCEITKISGLAGWSEPAQKFWRDEIGRQISDRANLFARSGEFKPSNYDLNGSSAGVTSASMERVKLRRDVSVKRQEVDTYVPGTEIPVYATRTVVESTVEDVIRVQAASFKLPVRPQDLPGGSSESAVVDATCRPEEATAAKPAPRARGN